MNTSDRRSHGKTRPSNTGTRPSSVQKYPALCIKRTNGVRKMKSYRSAFPRKLVILWFVILPPPAAHGATLTEVSKGVSMAEISSGLPIAELHCSFGHARPIDLKNLVSENISGKHCDVPRPGLDYTLLISHNICWERQVVRMIKAARNSPAGLDISHSNAPGKDFHGIYPRFLANVPHESNWSVYPYACDSMNALRGGLTRVCHGKVEDYAVSFIYVGFRRLDAQIGPYLSLTDISGGYSHPLGFSQRSPDQVHRSKAEHQAYQAGVSHDPRKPSHNLLGIKVALGALTVLGGFYFLANAVTQERRAKVGPAVALYPICGLISIAAGSLIIAYSLLG
ncbi:hypothetical protein [Pararhodobacter sp.]|uniref:hypothetical protein n=1 Tax=Pararhodobacter sp. TaxID=2127056 RepID=UPI002FDEE1FD